MKAGELNNKLVEGYLKLLENLTPLTKLELISKLSVSVSTDLKKTNKTFKKSFGAWESSETADELVEQLYNSRTFTRQTESL